MLVKYDNLLHLTVIRPMESWSVIGFEPKVQMTGDLTPGLAKGLAPVLQVGAVEKSMVTLQSHVYFIAPLFLLLLIAALPFLRGPATTAACLLLLLDYAYQVLSIAVFTPWGSARYEANFYLLPLIVSCMIFGQVASDWLGQKQGEGAHHGAARQA